MTDAPGAEHWIAILGGVTMGVLSLLAWASGDREGKQINAATERDASSSSVAAAVGGAAGAGLIDLSAYRAVIDGIEAMTRRLDGIDMKMARLVELGENQDEREERENQHRSLVEEFRTEIRAVRDELRADIARGEERRAAGRSKPTA